MQKLEHKAYLKRKCLKAQTAFVKTMDVYEFIKKDYADDEYLVNEALVAAASADRVLQTLKHKLAMYE